MVDINRRVFLKGLLVVAASAMLPSIDLSAAPAEVEVPKLPWPYEELDPEYVRKLGHLGYYAFECSGGSFWAIITALREKVGYPYTLLPVPTLDEVEEALEKHEELPTLMRYGAGGVVGWASLCGALNGSLSAVNIVTKDWKAVGKKLMRWYEATPLPTKISNEYAVNHQFLVKKYKSDKPLPQSVSGSVLCHVSVTRWCEKSGYASGSAERSERCARLVGDTVAEAVKLLNAAARGELETVAAIPFSSETASCRTCHFKGKNYEEGQFTRGMMECETCHKDMRPHAYSIVSTSLGGGSVNQAKDLILAGTLTTAAVGTAAGIWGYLLKSEKKERAAKSEKESK